MKKIIVQIGDGEPFKQKMLLHICKQFAVIKLKNKNKK